MRKTDKRQSKPVDHRWQVGLLDSFRIEQDGDIAAPLADRKQDLLLALLALEPRRAHPRETIARMLWPDRTLERARYRLGEVLHLLRRDLAAIGVPDNAILATRAVLQLGPGFTTDLAEFESLIQEAQREQAPVERATLLEDALQMSGRGLLPRLHEPWLKPHKAKVNRLTATAETLLAASTGSSAGQEAAPVRDARRDLSTSPHTFVDQRMWQANGSPMEGISSPAAGQRGDSTVMASTDYPPAEPSAPAMPASEWLEGRPYGRFRRRHALQLLELAESYRPSAEGANRDLWIATLESRKAELDAALEWALGSEEREVAVRFSAALWPWWYAGHRIDEGRRHVEAALLLRPRSRTRYDADAFKAAGILAAQAGDLDLAEDRISRSLEIWDALGERVSFARCLQNLATLRQRQDRLEEARDIYARSIEILRDEGADWALLAVLLNAAQVENAAGRPHAAELLQREQLELVRITGDEHQEARTLAEMATTAQVRADYEMAEDLLEAAFAIHQRHADLRGMSVDLRSLGFNAHKRGDVSAARIFYERSIEIARSLGDHHGVGESLRYLAWLEEKDGSPDEAVQLYRRALLLLEDIGDAAGASEARESLARLAASNAGAED